MLINVGVMPVDGGSQSLNGGRHAGLGTTKRPKTSSLGLVVRKAVSLILG
jgi:hypothetical protein